MWSRFIPYEARAALGIGSSAFYVYLNYLMVDEEMDDMAAGAWQYCSRDGRKDRGAAALVRALHHWPHPLSERASEAGSATG